MLCCAVSYPVIIRIVYKLFGSYELIEFLIGDEEVYFAFDFAFARLAGRYGRTFDCNGVLFQILFDESALTYACRSGDYDQLSVSSDCLEIILLDFMILRSVIYLLSA